MLTSRMVGYNIYIMPPRSVIKCPLCDWSKKKGLEQHIIDVHDTSSKSLWDSINSGPGRCKCKCGKETTFINWKKGYSKFIIGHNASIYSSYDEDTAKKIANSRGANWRGKDAWSKGLTKETDERVAKRASKTSIGRKLAIDNGDISIWSKGLTKTTDERLQQTSNSLKEGFKSGKLVPWAKGLSKETDTRIQKMSASVSLKLQQHDLRKRLDDIQRLSKKEIQGRIEKSGNLTLLDDLSGYINDLVSMILVRCSKCGIQFSGHLRKLQFGNCVECQANESQDQHEIANFISDLGIQIERCSRSVISPKELDIWIPSRNFAVEFNGLYWHSEMKKSAIYHSSKTEACAALEINLMHVFQDEWKEKKDIVKSMILHRLGLSARKLGARKLLLRPISKIERANFFEMNHIDGDVTASAAFGLVVPETDEIVSAISLRKPFHKKHANALEIARFCSKNNTSVAGALGRLVKKSVEKAIELNYADGLITYVDTRFGGGKSYQKAGFNLIGRTPNRFWWTDCTNRFNRFKFRADKKENMTEAQVAQEAGVIKIWGCPNLIYEMKI